MAELMLQLQQGYHNVMDKYSDPRTKDWFLVKNPMTLIMILVSYVYFCNVAGPRIMRNRKPYDLKKTLMIYNIFQILLSAYMVYEVARLAWISDYGFRCIPVDYSNDPKAVQFAAVAWVYFVAKITELLDTVFFILRKKTSQVSTLHLYHHTLMPIASWLGVLFVPGGHGYLTGLLNSFVHVIMYTYYLIAGLGPEYQKYVWWKKHLTALQLIQFSILFCHNFSALFQDCNYPKVFLLLCTFETCLFMYMFGSFYYLNYINKRKNTKETTDLNKKST